MQGQTKRLCVKEALAIIEKTSAIAEDENLSVKLDYIDMNNSETLEVLGDEEVNLSGGNNRDAVILSGAVWIGKTRLIDNLIISETSRTI